MIQAFHELVKKLTGYDVIPLENARVDFTEFNVMLQRIAERSADAMEANPIVRPSPNNVGNDVKKYVINSLKEEPSISVMSMRYKMGYPDIKIHLHATEEIIFLECKTFGSGKKNYSMRSFYLSPGKAITTNVDCKAPHAMISFEMSRQGDVFTPVAYKLIDLYDVPCKLKKEWHANNQDLYADQRVLVSKIR